MNTLSNYVTVLNIVMILIVEIYIYLFCRTPEQCPSVVSLLSESYNPHVRYGAALALGISCAGTGNKVRHCHLSTY